MCHFLEPSMDLGLNMSYSTDIWHSSCFYEEQYETVKRRQWNRCYRHYIRNLLLFLSELDMFNHLKIPLLPLIFKKILQV